MILIDFNDVGGLKILFRFCNGTTIKWCEQELWRVGKEVGGDRSGMWNFTHSVCIPFGVVDGLKVEDGRLVVVCFNVVVSCVVHR